MAVSSSPVEIIIKVVDANSGAVISQIERSFQQMGAAGATTGAKASAAMAGMAGSARVAEGSFRKLAEATAEMNFVQARNREILAALRKGEVSASQAMLDLTESMQEQTAAAEALAAARAELRSMGPAEEAGGHFQTSFDRVRLLRTELGVQMPRAMESIIARTPALMAAINAFGSALVAIGAVTIFAGVAREMYNVYERYLSLNAAAHKYALELQEAKLQDFGNTHSIETTIDRIHDATQAVKDYRSEAQDLHAFSLGQAIGALAPGAAFGGAAGIAGLVASKHLADASVDMQRQLDKLRKEQFPEQQHQLTLLSIDATHSNARLRGEQKITAEYGKQNAIIKENAAYRHQEDAKYGNPVAPEVIDNEAKLQDQIALNNEENQIYELRRAQSIELRHLQDAALQSRLRGSALYQAQESAAIADLKDKDMDSVAARNAIHEKFHNEEMRRLEDERNEVAKRAREADNAGLTGLAKIQATGAERDQDILTNVRAGKYASLADAQQDRLSNYKQTLAEMATAQRSFSSQVDQIVDQSTAHQLTGFARIMAEEKRQLDDWKKKFNETYGQLSHSSPEYQRGQSYLQRAQAAIRQDSDKQSQDLARRNSEETAAIEAQARIRSLTAEKQRTAAIEAEYEERTRKLMDELQQQEIGWDDYNRRVSAAAEQRDAEMVQAATEAREKMARQFDQVFRNLDHPLRMLQEIGAKAAGEAAAEMVQRYQMRHQHAQTAIATGNPIDFLGSIFGVSHASTTQHGEHLASASTHDMTDKSMAIAAAQIQIGTAQIAFGASSSSSSDFLGGTGLPSRGTSITGVPTASTASGIGFSRSTSRVIGGGFSSANDLGNFLFSGGAGSGATPEAPARTFGGMSPSPSSGGGVLNDLQQGMGLFGQAKDIFGKKPGDSNETGLLEPTDKDIGDGTLNADGSYTSASKGTGMLNGGGFGANAMGAAGGALGLYGAYEGNGGIGGAAGGAMSGMELGMALGGPVGAAVGAAAGAIVGAIGFGGREKARVYDLKTVRPRIQADQLAYNTGSMDYSSAYSDLQSLDVEAKRTLDKMGPAAKSYYRDTVEGEIHHAIQRFNNEEKAGRSMYTASAAQYDQGGWTGDFGSMATGPNSGWAHMRSREFVVQEQPAATHAGALEAIRAGATHAQMAAYYGANTMPAESGGDVHLHVHAIDAKSSVQFLMANKHAVRSALNASYAENSGGSDA